MSVVVVAVAEDPCSHFSCKDSMLFCATAAGVTLKSISLWHLRQPRGLSLNQRRSACFLTVRNKTSRKQSTRTTQIQLPQPGEAGTALWSHVHVPVIVIIPPPPPLDPPDLRPSPPRQPDHVMSGMLSRDGGALGLHPDEAYLFLDRRADDAKVHKRSSTQQQQLRTISAKSAAAAAHTHALSPVKSAKSGTGGVLFGTNSAAATDKSASSVTSAKRTLRASTTAPSAVRGSVHLFVSCSPPPRQKEKRCSSLSGFGKAVFSSAWPGK